MKRTWFILLLFITAAVISVLLFFPTDKKRIWRVITACEEAVMNEELDALMEKISYNYSDDYGGSYILLKRRMQSIFNRLDTIAIEDQLIKISVHEKKAEAVLDVSVTASDGQVRTYIMGAGGSRQRVIIYLEKSPYTWEVVKVEGVVYNN